MMATSRCCNTPPLAKVRVWVVLDGKTVYLDRNGDGDLTGKDERFEFIFVRRLIVHIGGLHAGDR